MYQKPLLVLVVLFVLLNSLQAQWQWEDISPDYGNSQNPFHLGCYAPNDSTFWAVPFYLNGVVDPKFSVTSDYGENWDVGTPDLGDPSLVPVIAFALNADTAWLGTQQMPNGSYGSLVATYDRGVNWVTLDLPDDKIPLGIHFYDGLEGVVVAQDFFAPTDHISIYRTTDGGLSWADVTPVINNSFVLWVYNGESILERVGDKLFVGNGIGQVLRSVDRGQTWTVTDTGLGEFRGIHSIAFEDELTGIALSSYDLDSLNNAFRNGVSVAVKTTDGGDTWTPINVPPQLEHIEYVPGSGGVYIGGHGYTGFPNYYISLDGGVQWQTKGGPGMINIVHTSPEHAYACVFSFEGGIVRYAGPPLLYDESPLAPSDWHGQGIGVLPVGNFTGSYINDLTILDAETLWAVTSPSRSQGNLPSTTMRSSDGGDSWLVQSIPGAAGAVTFDIHAFDTLNAIISMRTLSGVNQLRRTTDGGASWQTIHSGGAAGGFVHFFDASNGVIINNDQAEVSQDGGATWQAPEVAPNAEAGDIQVLNFTQRTNEEFRGDKIWFVSPSEKIFISDDRGQNWKDYATPVAFTDIAMKDSLNGLAVETLTVESGMWFDSTTIYRTTDGGLNWTVASSLRDSFSILFLDYVSGSSGSYIGGSLFNASSSYTNDDGTSWTMIDENFNGGPSRFFDNTTGWVFNSWGYEGYEPVIYKWNGAPFPELLVNAPEAQASSLSLTTYPNPATASLQAKLPEQMAYASADLILYNSQGQRIRQWQGILDAQLQLDVLNLPAGAYTLHIQTVDALATAKFVKL